MKTMTEPAFGKLNLSLDILRRRPDGYHDLDMVMISCEQQDLVTVALNTGTPWKILVDQAAVPSGRENLAWRAAEAFFAATGFSCDGLTITLKKQIPSGAGMAGGSSDAAAVLRILNRCFGAPLDLPSLCAVGECVGSDVPYCVCGDTRRAQGRGEILTPLPPMPDCEILLCKPPFSISTPELFRAADASPTDLHPDTDAMICALGDGNLPQIGALLCNVFQPIVEKRYPQCTKIVQTMREFGACGAAMTGTGSCFFGLFSDQKAALDCSQNLRRLYPETRLVHPVTTQQPLA